MDIGCWTGRWQRPSELTGGIATVRSALLVLGLCGMLLTDSLGFNIGVYCLRIIVEYPSKAATHFACRTEQRRYNRAYYYIQGRTS